MVDYSRLFEKNLSPEFNEQLNRAFGENVEILGSSLLRAMGKVIPVVKRVPRFVGTDSYASSFSYQWRRFSRTQLDSEQHSDLTLRDLVSKLQLKPEFFRNKLVLDIGVGVGRHAEYFCKAGAYFIGIDLSESIVQAEANLRKYSNGVVCQADLFHLPFNPGVFDLVYSIGVLHHTPSWNSALSTISTLPRTGTGLLSVWLYGEAFSRRDEWIKFTKQFDKEVFLNLCEFLVGTHREVKIQNQLPSSLLRLVAQHFPFSVHHPNMERSVLALFDGYSPDFHAVTSSRKLADEMRLQGYSVRPGEVQASCIGQRGA